MQPPNRQLSGSASEDRDYFIKQIPAFLANTATPRTGLRTLVNQIGPSFLATLIDTALDSSSSPHDREQVLRALVRNGFVLPSAMSSRD